MDHEAGEWSWQRGNQSCRPCIWSAPLLGACLGCHKRSADRPVRPIPHVSSGGMCAVHLQRVCTKHADARLKFGSHTCLPTTCLHNTCLPTLASKHLPPNHAAGAEVRERDEETGQVWTYPEGGSTDFEDGASPGDESASSLLGLSSGSSGAGSEAGGGGGRRRQRGQRKVETQPFPEQALNAARLGAAMQAAEEAGIELPAALRAGGSSSAGSSSSSRSASPSGRATDPASGSSSSSGGSSKKAEGRPAAVHIYPFGIDGAELVGIAESLGVRSRLALAERVQDADAVLALRAKIKTGERCAKQKGWGCVLQA